MAWKKFPDPDHPGEQYWIQTDNIISVYRAKNCNGKECVCLICCYSGQYYVDSTDVDAIYEKVREYVDDETDSEE